MSWTVPLFVPDIGKAELAVVNKVLRSRWLTMGEVTGEFEFKFAGFVGTKHAVAVSNGTAALHLALLALGVGPGDEVICPSLTFVATANAVRYCGATPVFADVESFGRWHIAPATIEPLLNRKTKAIIAMHYAGFPCEMPMIMELARARGLAVVEDAAHAPGASLEGKAVGAWGDVGCFSFFSNKNMTTGEGGMVTTDRGDVAERVRRLRSHGMTSLTLDRHKGHAFSYDVVDLGFNYRIGELNAALGIAQLAELPRRNRRRSELVERYRDRLAQVPGLRVPFAAARGRSAFHVMPVLLEENADRGAVMEGLRAAGIQSSIHYRPVHEFSAYRNFLGETRPNLPLTSEIGRREITLPLFPGMSFRAVSFVSRTMRQLLTSSSKRNA